MTSISLLGNQPKVFGFLYIAVFSNGTVKAGRSTKDPHGRVTAHANSGKAFDVHLDSAFYASIYTGDVSVRERLMHEEIGLLARLTAGKEWFKFACATSAVNFASAYLCKVERMSFAERPSSIEIAEQAALVRRALEARFPLLPTPHPQKFTLPSPATDSELSEIASLMNEYSESVVASMASKIVCLEEQYSESSIDGVSKVPVLSDVINAHFAEHDRICDLSGALPLSSVETYLDEVLKRGCTYNRDEAVKIIQAAAAYPAFFYEALGFKVVAA